jgi:hypothetical protein
MNGNIKAGIRDVVFADRFRSVTHASFLSVLAAFILEAGCSPPTIWFSEEAKSPDGMWIAYARTVENSGFGTGAVVTDVYLKRTTFAASSMAILSLTHDHNLPSQSGKTIHLTMAWQPSNRLEVAYDGHADIGFQVVKLSNITIVLRDRSRDLAGG